MAVTAHFNCKEGVATLTYRAEAGKSFQIRMEPFDWEEFLRLWRKVLGGSTNAFQCGQIQVDVSSTNVCVIRITAPKSKVYYAMPWRALRPVITAALPPHSSPSQSERHIR